MRVFAFRLNFERFYFIEMEKVIKVVSSTVIFLFILSVFGWMVAHLALGDKNYGFFNAPIKFLYSFPDMFTQSVQEVKSLPKTFLKTPDGFTPVNELDTDVLILSSYSDENDTRSIILKNLKNDSVLHKWNVKNPYESHDRIIHPMLLPDKNLVYSFMDKSVFRIDSLSKIVWRQDDIFSDHSINIDSNNDIWVCSKKPVWHATGFYKLGGRKVFYLDNYITKLDVETGQILYHKSISDILVKNNLAHYLIKSPRIEDPIHVNDIQPALKTTKYYNEGDLFISLRQTSIILHYRPSINRVITVIEGPFIAQHDVDILNDSTLVFFNNNSYGVWSSDGMKGPPDPNKLVFSGDFFSNIISYNLRDKSFNVIGEAVFRKNEIYSHTEGLIEFIDPTTYFVEEQNSGVIWIIKDDRVVYKNVFKSQHDGYHHLTNWIRTIKP